MAETLNEHLQEKYTDVHSDQSHRIRKHKKGKKLKPTVVIQLVRYNIRNNNRKKQYTIELKTIELA